MVKTLVAYKGGVIHNQRRAGKVVSHPRLPFMSRCANPVRLCRANQNEEQDILQPVVLVTCESDCPCARCNLPNRQFRASCRAYQINGQFPPEMTRLLSLGSASGTVVLHHTLGNTHLLHLPS